MGLEDKEVVFYVGRLIDKKGFYLLIFVMSKVIKKYLFVVLLLVGSKWYGNNEENDYVCEIKVKVEKLGVVI